MHWLFFIGCFSALPLFADDDLVELRREYNQAAASVDTLVRLYGEERLGELSEQAADEGILPAGSKLVLIFWADDEAELYLNDNRIGDTRLTPTRIEIPEIYLRESNTLRAHCWDTDRVESGFMAGLYLQDASARLRQVLVTDEKTWWVKGALAEERYYINAHPDIPGAEVIWGAGLFGEIVLQTSFDAARLRQVSQGQPLQARAPSARREPMETHLVVSRLVQLQDQRMDLARRLEARRSTVQDVRYQGFIKGRLAFTLGKAGALAEASSVPTAEKLLEWAEALPAEDRDLVFRERRELKGVGDATEARGNVGGQEEKNEKGDRRVDYVAPDERGPVYGEGDPSAVGGGSVAGGVLYVGRRIRWDLWLSSAGLLAYLGMAGRQWWKLFRAKVWLS